MRHEALADSGTALPESSAALVWNEDGSFTLIVPDAIVRASSGGFTPRGVALLAAIAKRIPDDEWVNETLEILED